MIERACELREPLSNMVRRNRSELPQLSDGDWELLEVVAHVLRAFERASRPLCGDTYPTLHRVVPTYNFLLDDLEGFLGLRDDEEEGKEKSAIINQCDPTNQCVLRDAIQAACEKICSYYRRTWADMYAIAVILDPRFKMAYYKVNNWEPKHIAHAKNALLRVVEEYGAAVASRPPSQANAVVSPPDDEDERTFRGLKQLRVEMGSEVERYLATPPIDSTSHVLEWWKHHANEYPCLALEHRTGLPCHSCDERSGRASVLGWGRSGHRQASIAERGHHPSLHVPEELVVASICIRLLILWTYFNEAWLFHGCE